MIKNIKKITSILDCPICGKQKCHYGGTFGNDKFGHRHRSKMVRRHLKKIVKDEEENNDTTR